MKRRHGRGWIVLVLILCACAPQIALAQAGPPMITNDTGSPGDGHWEINLAATGDYTRGTWNVTAPDADINYGVGEHIQLTIHPGWAHRSAPGEPLVSGIAPTELAVRWRFLDQEKAGVDVAVQPHLILPGPHAAVEKNLSPSGREFILPVQVVHRWQGFTGGIEIARHWVEHERGADQLGVFVARNCSEKFECLAEINSTHDVGGNTVTFAGLGARRAISDHVKLMGAFEKQVNGPWGQRDNMFYLGIQLAI